MAEGTQGPAALIGQVVGGYRLERVLGKGASGVVFLSRWAGSGERLRVEHVGGLSVELPDEVAIKTLILPWQFDDAERADFRARFQREAETQQQRLRHPHIVTVLAYGEDAASGLAYMVQPYLRGGTLADRMAARTGPVPLAEIAAITRQLADGLDYAHHQGVIHRDIKPANVLLNERGEAYRTAFSIVRLLQDTQSKLTATGQVLGTPQYMATEQLASGQVGPAADIYGLGMVAYELVTGRPAFEGPSLVDVLRQQTRAAPPASPALRPDLPAPAEAALLKALAKRPEDRFASASAFAEAFERGLQGQWPVELAASGSQTTVASTPPPTMVGAPPWAAHGAPYGGGSWPLTPQPRQ
ncbi:MAG: serine/threonine-protein kinase, partial [Ktedonobacterales bacterium]